MSLKKKILSEYQFPKEVAGTSRWEKSIFNNLIINPDVNIFKSNSDFAIPLEVVGRDGLVMLVLFSLLVLISLVIKINEKES